MLNYPVLRKETELSPNNQCKGNNEELSFISSKLEETRTSIKNEMSPNNPVVLGSPESKYTKKELINLADQCSKTSVNQQEFYQKFGSSVLTVVGLL